jgi:rod shape-determining protein MreC
MPSQLYMRNLFNLILRYHFILLFIVLETISFTLIVTYNNYQRASFLDSGNFFTGSLYEWFSSYKQYFNLKKVNVRLAEENALLRTQLQEYLTKSNYGRPVLVDSLYLPSINTDSLKKANFFFSTARVINNSINQQHNFITINKGRFNGVKLNMGVIADGHVVGLVFNSSEHYSTVISLLNSRWKVSAKIKSNDYFGSLSWDGRNYRKAMLNEIPYHVPVHKGDTVVTSGFSPSFPEGLVIGTISDYSIGSGSNFYKIEVTLAADFKNLVMVGLIENKKQYELNQLELVNRSAN